MTAMIWRLHRRQVAFATASFAALAIVLMITGLRMHGDYSDALATCGAAHSCGDLSSELFQGDGLIIDLVLATMAVPLLLGMFWGVPIVAREIEEGTQDLAWTQSVTRRQWLSSNVTAVVLAAATWGAGLAVLVTWWCGPENALNGRLSSGRFDVQALVPVAYSVFAVALGLAAGTWFRRVLPALATTLGVFVVVRVVTLQWVRPHYLSPIRRTFPLVNNSWGAPPGSWIVSRDVIDRFGHIVTKQGAAFAPCTNSLTVSVTCMARLGYRRLVVFQPAHRFWTFQLIEAAIFALLAAVLVGLAFWRCLHSDA